MGVRENSISTCGCEDANARLDECCLWDAARLCSVARQKKRDAQEVKNVVSKNADE